jgi:hypothetical protein
MAIIRLPETGKQNANAGAVERRSGVLASEIC